MKCDFCGINESVLFVQQVSAGTNVELHLCAECAKKRGITAVGSKVEFSLTNVLADLLQAKNKQLFPEDSLCPVCGQGLQALLKTRKAGCPECYTAFREHIGFCAKKDTVPYAGNLPKRLENFRSVLTDRLFYQSKLEQAVKNEEYEKAAMYRDRMKALDSAPVQGSGREKDDGQLF